MELLLSRHKYMRLIYREILYNRQSLPQQVERVDIINVATSQLGVYDGSLQGHLVWSFKRFSPFLLMQQGVYYFFTKIDAIKETAILYIVYQPRPQVRGVGKCRAYSTLWKYLVDFLLILINASTLIKFCPNYSLSWIKVITPNLGLLAYFGVFHFTFYQH
jgi:hypothetical protein